MVTVNIKEARKRLSDLIHAAERGESVVITRRGRKVAKLGPVGREAAGNLPDLAEFRKSLKVKGKSLSEIVIATRAQERY